MNHRWSVMTEVARLMVWAKVFVRTVENPSKLCYVARSASPPPPWGGVD